MATRCTTWPPTETAPPLAPVKPTRFKLTHYLELPELDPHTVGAWAREEVLANTCLGTTARMQEELARLFAGLADRTADVRSRCRRTLQPLAEAVSLESHQAALHVGPIGASV